MVTRGLVSDMQEMMYVQLPCRSAEDTCGPSLMLLNMTPRLSVTYAEISDLLSRLPDT